MKCFLSALLIFATGCSSTTPLQQVKQPLELVLPQQDGLEDKPILNGETVVIQPVKRTILPSAKGEFSLSILPLGFNSTQLKKLESAKIKVIQVLKSPEFKQMILNHEYAGVKTFVQNNNLTNDQVYTKIMEGAESLNGLVDYEMDLKVQMYYSWKAVVGYTTPNIDKIFTNSKFYNVNSECRVGSNLVHEWSHKLGFGHDFKQTKRRPYSVPYALNRIFETICTSKE